MIEVQWFCMMLMKSMIEFILISTCTCAVRLHYLTVNKKLFPHSNRLIHLKKEAQQNNFIKLLHLVCTSDFLFL